MTVGLTQEAQRAAYRQLPDLLCGRFVLMRSVRNARIDIAVGVQALGFLRQPNLRLERIYDPELPGALRLARATSGERHPEFLPSGKSANCPM